VSESADSPSVLFYEAQRPPWTIGTTALTAVSACFLVVTLVRDVTPFDVFAALLTVASFIASLSRLHTVLRSDRLDLERSWLPDRSVPIAEIRSARVAPYYHRIDRGFGVRDGRSVILKLEDGDVLHVGSAHAATLCAAIRDASGLERETT
jgi:hypothetical protein